MKVSSVRRKRKIVRRHRDARGNLHPALHLQQRRDAFHDRVIAAAAALEGTLRVMDFLRAVDADGDGEAMLLEKAPVVLGQQRAVGGDREGDLGAAARGQFQRRVRVAARSTLRLTSGSPPRNARLSRAPGSALPTSRSTARSASASSMFFGRPAELALLGVAIGAAEIAFLGDRQRKRAQRRRRQRRIVDEGAPTSPAWRSSSSIASSPPSHRRVVAREQVRHRRRTAGCRRRQTDGRRARSRSDESAACAATTCACSDVRRRGSRLLPVASSSGGVGILPPI